MKRIHPPLLKSQVNVILSLGLVAVVAYGAATLVTRAAGISDPTAEAIADSGLLD